MRNAQVFDDIRVHVDPHAVLTQLRVKPNSAAAPRVESLVARVQEVARPRALYRACHVERRDEKRVWIDGVAFASRALSTILGSANCVFPYIVTCGHEIEALTSSDSGAFEGIAFDAIANQLLLASCSQVERWIGQSYELGLTATMGPGAGDGELWPLEQQRALFSLLGDTESSIGVELTDDHMMVPMKSLSGLLFPTESNFSSCQLCTSQGCALRDAPFDQVLRDTLVADEPVS